MLKISILVFIRFNILQNAIKEAGAELETQQLHSVHNNTDKDDDEDDDKSNSSAPWNITYSESSHSVIKWR